MNFLFGEFIHPVPSEWKANIERNCKGLFIPDIGAETENFVKFNLAFTVAGTYIGLIIEQKWMGTRKYNQWH